MTAVLPIPRSAEFCSVCHDVTNPLTIKNRAGRWVGGFPIERTYAEWASSRYADRPGNANSGTARSDSYLRGDGDPGIVRVILVPLECLRMRVKKRTER